MGSRGTATESVHGLNRPQPNGNQE